MSKPIIGIIGRRDKIVNKIDREGNVVLYDYMPPLDKEDASYIGLITNNEYKLIDEDVLKLCDGILMTGGVEIKTYHIEIIKYAIAHRIPFLGVCQGAQALALSTLTGAKLLKIESDTTDIVHNPTIASPEDLKKVSHSVVLTNDSILHKLFGESVLVNSNHNYAIPMVNEPMKVVGQSSDGVIEAIEHIDSDIFAVGVQWHPEIMESMQPLFKEFVDRARKRSVK